MTTTHDTAATSRAVQQITLPGQAATPEGPLDMTAMYLMHHAFRRDLQAFVGAARRTPVGARVTWQALERRWLLFSFVLHHHHHGEDAAYWPLLKRRVPDTDHATLDAMEAEHGAIDPLLTRATHGFRTMSHRGTLLARKELAGVLEEALDHLDRHLAHEEVDAIPLLHAHVTPEEDEEIERTHFRAGVPLRTVVRIVPWAMHEVPEPQRAVVLHRLGAAYRMIWRLARPWFARADRIAMRYAR